MSKGRVIEMRSKRHPGAGHVGSVCHNKDFVFHIMWWFNISDI